MLTTGRKVPFAIIAAVVLIVASVGCSTDSNVPTDVVGDVQNDISTDAIDDVVTVDSVNDTRDTLVNQDVTLDVTADVPVDVPPACQQATYPAVDDGKTKFALTMFHWNIQYVAGGLIGEYKGETISICGTMFGDDSYCEGWTDDALNDWIIRISFMPVLDMYLAHPDWRVTFEIPGLMIQAITERHPDVLAKLQCAANSGQVEIVSFHWSDQLFLAFPSRDLQWSLELNREVFEEAAIPVSKIVFNQEGQSGLGKHRFMADNGFEVDVMSSNLYKYVQQADSASGVWPVYESTGPGTDKPVLVVVGGGVDPAAGIEVAWPFFDDGEVLATPGNPYFAPVTPVHDAGVLADYEEELQALADGGYLITTITDYIARLDNLGITPQPLLPIGDSTWQPTSTDGISRWLGRMGTIGYSLHEQDNYIRTDNYKASTCLGAAAQLAEFATGEGTDVTAEFELIDAGYLDLIRAEVSDATGINPWLGEWVYGETYNASAKAKCNQAAGQIVTKMGKEFVTVDLDNETVTVGANEYPVFDFLEISDEDRPINVTATGSSRNVEINWRLDEDIYKITVAIGPSDDPTGEVREKRTVTLEFPRFDEVLRYSPGLVEDAVVSQPFAEFSFQTEQVYLPLANGLIGLGDDWWLIKRCSKVHLAARVSVVPESAVVQFIDETIPPEGNVTWEFFLLQGSVDDALGFARIMNTNPTVVFAQNGQG
jgi:hypothetical protein